MISRKWLVLVPLLGPGLLAGCGSQYSNENVPVKVVTQKDLDGLAQQGDKSREQMKGLGPLYQPPAGAESPQPNGGR